MTEHPELVDRRLENGLRVVLLPDARVPVIGLALSYAVGSRHEPQGRSGFAHLFEHMMFQGSANVEKGEHFAIVEAAGGRTNAYTGLDATVYTDTLPSHQLELALWLEADRMRSLGATVSQATLDNQREVVKNERRKKVDNAVYGTWEERLFALSYPPDHPYHHSSWGSDMDLDAASLDAVRAFFAEHYLPNNATLAVAGDVDVDEAMEAIERQLGAVERGPSSAPSFGGAPVPAAGRVDVVEDVPLPRLYVGCLTPPLGGDGFDAADFITDLLTTGRASRLQRRLVRGTQLAQSIEAWIVPLVDGASLVVLEATAREGVAADRFEEAIHAELDGLAERPPDEDELNRVRRQRARRRASARQQVEQRADMLAMYSCLIDDPERFGSEDRRDAAMGPDDIRALGASAFARASRNVVRYLPTRAG
jgi:zinc protease